VASLASNDVSQNVHASMRVPPDGELILAPAARGLARRSLKQES
jgi:hypothetical protein